jgi:hypothetical protein
MSQRFFRSSAAVYEAMRTQLDAAFGYPDGVTETVWQPLASAMRDSRGRCLLAVHASSCERPAVAAMLPQLIASGAVEEITAGEYQPAIHAPDPLQG